MYNVNQFSAVYFGSQVNFWKDIKSLIPEDASTYFDYTMGGFGNPLRAGYELKMNVVVNDLCDYPVIAARAIFQDSLTGETQDEVTERILRFPRIDGVFTEMKKSSKTIEGGGPFSLELCRFVDGVCATTTENRIKFAIGKSLMDTTFRGLGWARTDPNSRNVEGWTPRILATKAGKWYTRFEEVSVQLRANGKQYFVLNEDCKLLAGKYADLHKGAFVYCDPAWPWALKFKSKNPYLFVVEKLSSILLQKETRKDQFRWEEMTDGQIADEVTDWVLDALKAGALRFVLNTQGTNRPNPEMLVGYCKEKDIIIEDVIKKEFKGTNNPFEETWIVCRR